MMQGKVVFFGDSDINFWDTDKSFPGSLNCGVSGTTMTQVFDYTAKMMEKYEPSVVVLVAGENDLAEGRPPAKVLEVFKELVAEVLKKEGCKLIYISCKLEPSTESLKGKYGELNDLIAMCINDDPVLSERCEFIDSYRSFVSETSAQPDRVFFRGDGLHLSAAGYQVWEKLVGKQLGNWKVDGFGFRT
mmetsp:Transcript_26280/g.41121  ORF Transcript_26280/g.41121 Transcript_26280/m.41121 type:complete len:189 (-) Transcript_26280:259-825(-)